MVVLLSRHMTLSGMSMRLIILKLNVLSLAVLFGRFENRECDWTVLTLRLSNETPNAATVRVWVGHGVHVNGARLKFVKTMEFHTNRLRSTQAHERTALYLYLYRIGYISSSIHTWNFSIGGGGYTNSILVLLQYLRAHTNAIYMYLCGAKFFSNFACFINEDK